jgi:hypothetical protein
MGPRPNHESCRDSCDHNPHWHTGSDSGLPPSVIGGRVGRTSHCQWDGAWPDRGITDDNYHATTHYSCTVKPSQASYDKERRAR